ncbi:MAG: hypothetical protein RLZZ511_2500 [Cyanobacteriota bacterium]|jgi:hypothetical protein
MAGSKRRSPTSTLVTKESIKTAGSILGDLPEKPKEIWSLREAIDALKDEITVALDRGYTYPEISQMLTARGVEISASTLKYYLSSVKRQDPNAKPRRRRRTLGAGISADSLNLGVTVPAEPKKRGRKPKAAVEATVVTAEPKKRGRKPKAAVEAVVVKTPGRKGRPPKVKTEDAAPVKVPAKRGPKPKATADQTAATKTTATKKTAVKATATKKTAVKATATKKTAVKATATKGTGRRGRPKKVTA